MVFQTLVEEFLDFLSIFQRSEIIGMIAVLMLICLIFSILIIATQNLHQNICLNSLAENLHQQKTLSPTDTSQSISNINSIVKSYAYPTLNRAWSEFLSSINFDQKRNQYFSPIDMHTIFTIEALNLNTKRWERVSSLFISIGLIFTFMGLVAALQQSGYAILTAGDQANDVKSSLSILLVVVSSKFILSITGLACSIIINLFIDYKLQRNQKSLNLFLLKLNKIVLYIPVEIILMDIRKSLHQIETMAGS